MKLFLKSSFLLLALFWVATISFAATDDSQYAPYPEPGSGYVTDHANLLTDEEEEQIETWLWQVEKRSNVEIIIVTIDSISQFPKTGHQTIEPFAIGLFNQYGIGNLPKNDGVLLLVARDDRKARIELGAYYGYQKNREAERIMQEVIVPQFKSGNYASGIMNGTEALITEFAGMQVGFPWFTVWIIILALLFAIIGYSLIKQGRKGWGYVFIGLAIVLALLAIYVIVQINRHMPDSGSGSWSSGGSGGFGGGSSGGGGATGSW